MLRRLQWVAFGGFACSVMSTTCLIFSGANGLTREKIKQVGISVKLSALHPRYEFAQHRRVMEELVPHLPPDAILTGWDFSTGGVKCLAFDLDGNTVAQHASRENRIGYLVKYAAPAVERRQDL